MKRYPLLLLALLAVFPGILHAQAPTVDDNGGTTSPTDNPVFDEPDIDQGESFNSLFEGDSLALVAIYQAFGGTASGLAWLDGPVDSWGTKENEIVVSFANQFEQLRVTAIDLSGKNLGGELPDAFSQLPAVRELDLSNNNFINVQSLEDRPYSFLDISGNYLILEDVAPLLSQGSESVIYEPQLELPEYTYYAIAGDSAILTSYPKVDTPLNNTFVWTRLSNSTVVGQSAELVFSQVSIQDEGLYELRATNTEVPGLSIVGRVNLKVYPDLDALPFDPTSLLVRRQDGSAPLPPEIRDNDIKVCNCTPEDSTLILVEGIESLIDLNNLHRGSTSQIRKDTFDLNFKIEIDPVFPTAICDIAPFRQSRPDATAYSARVAVVGSGIDRHESLWPLFAQIDPLTAANLECNIPNQLSWDFTTSDYHVAVANQHETHISGIISKNYPANVDLKLIDLKILDQQGELFDLICALRFAKAARAQVINLSLGYQHDEPSETLYQALKAVRQSNAVVVVSAGNTGSSNDSISRWPGNFVLNQSFEGRALPALNNIIVVAALNEAQDSLADFSNFGVNTVHIAAPGTNTLSTVINSTGQSSYTAFSGSSMSAGEVSKAASIVKAYLPGVSAARVKGIILETAVPIYDTPRPPVQPGKKLSMDSLFRYLAMPYMLPGTPEPELTEEALRSILQKEHPSVSQIRIPLGDGTKIYKDVEFEVTQIPTPQGGNPVYKSYCPYGNVITWDGRLPDGTVIDPDEAQYIVDIKINGRQANVNNPKISVKN